MLQSFRAALLLTAALLAGTGCVQRGGSKPLEGIAQDEWTRTYTLEEGGEVQIANQNGPIDVQGVDGNSVDVRIERVAHAATNEAAAEIVPRIRINEDVTPSKIAVRIDGLSGLVIGVRISATSHVRVPKTATIRVRGNNGVSVKGMSGRVIVNGANGGVTAEDLSGGVELRSVNGDANVKLKALNGDLIDIRAVNGQLNLTLPASVDANLTANVTNGTIDIGELKLEPFGDQTPRRVRGKLNAGGAPLDISAVNGNVTVRTAP